MDWPYTPKKPAQGPGACEKIVCFIADESGSMETCRSAMISGYNEFVGDLKREKDMEIRFSLTKFSTAFNPVHVAVPIAEVPEWTPDTYTPDGYTALYDAIGGTVKALERELKDVPGTPTIVVVIMTDGGENSSKEFTREQIRALIQEKEALGNWSFAYQGANQDAWAVGATMGFHAGNTQTYNVADSAKQISKVSSSTRQLFRSGKTQTHSFYKPDDE